MPDLRRLVPGKWHGRAAPTGRGTATFQGGKQNDRSRSPRPRSRSSWRRAGQAEALARLFGGEQLLLQHGHHLPSHDPQTPMARHTVSAEAVIDAPDAAYATLADYRVRHPNTREGRVCGYSGARDVRICVRLYDGRRGRVSRTGETYRRLCSRGPDRSRGPGKADPVGRPERIRND